MIRRTLTVLSAAALLAVPVSAKESSSVTSPDGRWRTSIRFGAGEAGAAGSPPSALWIADTRTGRERLLFRGRTANDPRHNTASIDNPHFSLDGGFVYVEADAYATSPAIHQVSVRTGEERFVVDGGLIGVLRDGPWRGSLLVAQHRYWPGGGSYDPVVLVRPDGYIVLTVPNSERSGDDAVAPWLNAKGWHAS